jgi:nanoRNase/pAp phosphatase (c-di-AMP/oligoRNAs hydrolase)
MGCIKELISNLIGQNHVFIQTHNFPDHDSISSAFGLQYILKSNGIDSDIIYKGSIQRESLSNMMCRLGIVANSYTDFNMQETDKIILIDGCKGNSNVDELVGEELAIIDHHQVIAPESVKYTDIRSTCGACSTIIYDYFSEAGMALPKNVASALLIGINMDTALMTRGVSENDINAYSNLYLSSDTTLVNSILRNSIQVRDLYYYQKLLDNVVIEDNLAFCYFKNGCNQNLLGILGDFLISIQEVDFVVLCAKNNNVINFSIRSENSKLNAAKIVQELLQGIGFGGGHSDMAGVIIKDTSKFSQRKIFEETYTTAVTKKSLNKNIKSWMEYD